MIKVNLQTLEASRESIPRSLQGLSPETLSNLQTELNPVPEEFKDIEWWSETDVTPSLTDTHTYDGTETLTAKPESKTVEVVRGIRGKTQEELDAERKALVPQSIAPRQAREVLIRNSMFAAVETAINNITDETEKLIARNYWEYSEKFERGHHMLLQLASSIGMTEEQLDTLFTEGAKL